MRPSERARLVTFALTVALAGAGGVGLGCKRAPTPVELAPSEVVTPAWQSGAQYVYALELESHFAISGAPMADLELRGDWVLEVREPAPGRVQFAASVRKPEFPRAATGAAPRPELVALATELAQPFAFTLASGVLSEISLPPNWSPVALGTARTLAAALQFTARPRASDETWKAKEFDATGSYEAEYRAGPGRLDVWKKKVAYEAVSMGKVALGSLSPTMTPRVLASEGELSFEAASPERESDGFRLTGVKLEEKVQTSVTPGSQALATTALRLRLSRVGPLPATFDWKATLDALEHRAPGDRTAPRAPIDRYDATRIGDYTFESAVAELERQTRDPNSTQVAQVGHEILDPAEAERRKNRLREQGKVFTALVAILRSQPARIEDALEQVDRDSPASAALLDALSAAGTPDAQAVLVRVMDDAKRSKALRRSAGFSLIRTERATPETVAALEQHLGGGLLAQHAAYGLGTIARHLREAGESERALAIVNRLLKLLEAADRPAQEVDALRGIANSGHSAAIDAVRSFLGDPSELVRAAAVDAVRLMNHPDVDGIIAAALEGPGGGAAHASALDAISVREPSDVLVGALQRAAVSEKKATLRLRAVRIMAEWQRLRPELRVTLEQVSRADEREHVRMAAKTALGG